MNLEPIGTVHAPVSAQVDEKWSDVVSEIHLEEPLARGLLGIEQFSHAVVIFLMHEATFSLATDLVRRPRGRADLPEVGIFAQRAKHRPNPIGLTAVRILGREGRVLHVRGLDAIDGTPVLDVKPYVPVFDRVEGAETPSWVGEIMKDYF
jgi:tRNA-Thr(GGU) m(6)t(6)A37 methyltransferase TsaA